MLVYSREGYGPPSHFFFLNLNGTKNWNRISLGVMSKPQVKHNFSIKPQNGLGKYEKAHEV